ncbi:TPA: hypothetical protein ROX79_004973 [Bacillus thuringiensis]|nr:hypothetical protein [Bacillus thuringiensis]
MTIQSLVLELKEKALNEEISISSLAKHALNVATKLKLKDFEDWIMLEIDGYENDSNLPSYRKCPVAVKTQSSKTKDYNDVTFPTAQMAISLSTVAIYFSISKLEDLCKSRDYCYEMPYAEPLPQYIKGILNTEDRVIRLITIHDLKEILNTVRNKILKWTIRLEREGILGEDRTLVNEAQNINKYITYNVIYGDVTNSLIQQGTSRSTQTNTIDYDFIKETLKELKEQIVKMEMPHEQKLEIDAGIRTAEIQLATPTKGNKSILRETFRSIRNICEGITASQVQSMLKEKLDAIISWFL